MDYWKEIIFLSFGISLILTALIIPQALKIAHRRHLFDDTGGRKIHTGRVPRLGGIAFLPSILCSVALAIGVLVKVTDYPLVIESGTVLVPLLFAICSMMLLYLVGFADDLVGVRYRDKFIIQIICAVLTLCSGVWLSNLYGFLWCWRIPDFVSWILTGFLIVYVTNAINLIDGIDGLASGISALALAFFGWMFYLEGELIYSMIAWSGCATLLAFFFYNVFGSTSRRTKIFMGDTGSLSVGMVIAFLMLELMSRPLPVQFSRVNPFLLAISPLIIPLFDLVRVFIHRLRCRRNPFLPDRSHIHHKLMAVGLHPSAVLSILLGCSVVTILFNVLLSPFVNVNILILIDVVTWIVVNMILTRRIRVREKILGKKLYV